jgi:hypothetical protein
LPLECTNVMWSDLAGTEVYMLLSAAHRNVILLPLVFLIGVWVGKSWLIDQRSDTQNDRRGVEIRSELEQRTPFIGGDKVLAKSEDSRTAHFGNKLGNTNPTAQQPARRIAASGSANSARGSRAGSDKQAGEKSGQQLAATASKFDASEENSGNEPPPGLSGIREVFDPHEEISSASYAFQVESALQSPAIAPSLQSIEGDIIRSLAEAGVSPEEIPSRVGDVMEMILQGNQQTPEAYPSISAEAANGTGAPCG